MNQKAKTERAPRSIHNLYGITESGLKAETDGAFVQGDYTKLSVGKVPRVAKGRSPETETIMASVDAFHPQKGRLHLRPVFMKPKEARRIAYALLALANELDEG